MKLAVEMQRDVITDETRARYCSDNCGRRPCRVAPVALLAMMGTRGRRGANPVTAVEV